MKVVVDTNVIVSGIFWKHGNPRKILEIVELEIIELLFSKETLEELSKVLDKHFKMSVKYREDIIRFLLEKAAVVAVTSSVDICSDRNDNKFLELAVDGNADYIVSGDKHLLEIKKFKGTRIVKPAEFLENLKK